MTRSTDGLNCDAPPGTAPRAVRSRVAGVDECKDAPQVRYEQLVELELLRDDVAGAEDSCEVSTRVRKALDQAVADRIRRMEEDNGDAVLRFRCRGLGGANRLIFKGDDDVHALANELLRLPVGLVRLEVSPDQPDVAAPDPPQLLEASLQRWQGRRDVIGADMHQTDTRNGFRSRLAALIAAGGEKTNNENGCAPGFGRAAQLDSLMASTLGRPGPRA